MKQLSYANLKVLIADDFSNFRYTINGMLSKLGINQIEQAANGDDVLRQCQSGRFDVILCDYDLGLGRNGQQVLEELRFRKLINKQTVFIIISANASKEVVMAAYDCAPDDYLMKPITAKMLEQRITRLLNQRAALAKVHAALDGGQTDTAARILTDISIGDGRYAVAAQKLLGEVFIQRGELAKAERLYTKALEKRRLDWARLGQAKVKQLMGDSDTAGVWLEQIVQDHPLFLPAYDALAENWHSRNDPVQSQATLQRSVAISPRSILRQKNLAATAEQNQDFETALYALKAVVRLGELSCHAVAEDSFNLARVAAKNVERKTHPAEPLLSEALEQLDIAREKFVLNNEQLARADILEGHALLLQGQEELGNHAISQAAVRIQQLNVGLETNLETLAALQAQGDEQSVQDFVDLLLTQYADDQEALQQLDILLAEPVSDSNQEMIATVNREGIDLYNASRFDEAIECFEKVLDIFPKHLGVHLNIVQSLVGKLKEGSGGDETAQKTRESLRLIESLIAPGNSHYPRFERLKKMAASCLEESRA